jgi:hypothetical protein
MRLEKHAASRTEHERLSHAHVNEVGRFVIMARYRWPTGLNHATSAIQNIPIEDSGDVVEMPAELGRQRLAGCDPWRADRMKLAFLE